MVNPFENLDWDVWLRGLWAAFVGGGAVAVNGGLALNIYDPKDFNALHLQFWKVLGVMFLTGGVTNFISYLKQKPLPDRKTVTTVVTVETHETGGPPPPR